MGVKNKGSDHAIEKIAQLTHTGDWAGKPFNLRPWQARIIRQLFKTGKDGRRVYRTCLLMLPRKNGKALDIETEVPTLQGYRRLAQIQVGDQLFGPDGQPTTVTFATDVMEHHACYRVKFSDGASITADAEHQWTVFDIWRDRYVTVTTATIAQQYRIGRRATHREFRYRIPVAQPLQYPARTLVIDPYALGAWLGDGHSASAYLTTADEEILEELAGAGVTTHLVQSSVGRSQAQTYSLGRAPLRNRDRAETFQGKLRSLGLLHQKCIPSDYLIGSVEQRWSLLQGLMDTDGTAWFSGPLRVPRCEFGTIHKHLAIDVASLIASLGMKPTILTTRAYLRGQDCGPSFRVSFTAYADQPVFRLRRKLERLASRPARRTRSMNRSIINVQEVPSVPVRCLQVDREDGLFLIGRECIQTHNTELAAAIGLYCLLFDTTQGEIYLAAADRDQASKVYHAMQAMIEQDAELLTMIEIVESQKRFVYRAAGTFCKAISAEAYSKHGFNASVVIYDELHCAPDRQLHDVLVTSQGGRMNPLYLAISTAGFDRQSILWELYAHAKRVKENPALDPTFLPIIYEAPQDADWTDEAVWASCNPALGDFRSIEEMRISCQRAKEIPAQENAFKRLYLNMWTEQAERWIPLTAWDACQVTA